MKCSGLNEKKINSFIQKLQCLYIKLNQLLMMANDSKINLIEFTNYLKYCSKMYNNESDGSDEKNNSKLTFEKLNCKRIITAIDNDLNQIEYKHF